MYNIGYAEPHAVSAHAQQFANNRSCVLQCNAVYCSLLQCLQHVAVSVAVSVAVPVAVSVAVSAACCNVLQCAAAC